MKILSVAVGGCFVDGKAPLIKFKRNIYTGLWGLPGGKFADDEYLPEAIEREFAEEIEHPVRFKESLGVVDELSVNADETWRLILHVCTVAPAGPVSTEPIDKAEGLIQWFTPAEIDALGDQMIPSDYRIWKDVILGKQPGYYKCRVDNRLNPPKLELFERV